MTLRVSRFSESRGRRRREPNRFAHPRTSERFRVPNDGAARKVVQNLSEATLDSATNTLHTNRHHRQSALLGKAVRDAHARPVVRPIHVISRGDQRSFVESIRYVERIQRLDEGLKIVIDVTVNKRQRLKLGSGTSNDRAGNLTVAFAFGGISRDRFVRRFAVGFKHALLVAYGSRFWWGDQRGLRPIKPVASSRRHGRGSLTGKWRVGNKNEDRGKGPCLRLSAPCAVCWRQQEPQKTARATRSILVTSQVPPLTTWRSGSAATPPCRDKQLSLITTSLGFGGAISVG